MEALFSKILNMSLTGSLVILAVMAARFFLKRVPKIFSYTLWAVVLFRLLCPISFSAPISALNWFAPEVEVTSTVTSTLRYVPVREMVAPVPSETFAAAPEREFAGDFRDRRISFYAEFCSYGLDDWRSCYADSKLGTISSAEKQAD